MTLTGHKPNRLSFTSHKSYFARLSEGPGTVWPHLLRYLGCESEFGAHNIFGELIYLSHSSEADVYRNGIL